MGKNVHPSLVLNLLTEGLHRRKVLLSQGVLKEEVGKVRECMAEMSQWNNGDFENNRKAIVEIVRNIVG